MFAVAVVSGLFKLSLISTNLNSDKIDFKANHLRCWSKPGVAKEFDRYGNGHGALCEV